MATADSIKAKLQSLIAQSNAATGNTDGDLTAAIAALIAGYGSGGGNAVQIGQESPSPSFMNLFYALEQGTAVTGTFTLASALSGETLIFSSGLAALNGIMLVNKDRTTKESNQEGLWLSIVLLSDGDIAFSFVLNTTYTASSGGIAPRISSYRFDGGDLYVTPTFGGSTQYTPFRVGETYLWVAW